MGDRFDLISQIFGWDRSTTVARKNAPIVEDVYESSNYVLNILMQFIKKKKVKKYIPPYKNDWLAFYLNSLYYIVLVLMVSIIGANLNILSEGMHKTKNGNSGLENILRKSFPHTQFAMDRIIIDKSIDTNPQKVGIG